MTQNATLVEFEGRHVQSAKIREFVLTCRQKMDATYLDAGAALKAVSDNRLFREWGFKTFEDYVEQELCWKPRKAYYLLEVARFYSTVAIVPKPDLLAVGFSKSIILMDAIKATPAEWEMWFARALKMSVRELQAAVDEAVGDGDAGDGSGEPNGSSIVETLHSLGFKLYDGQKAVVEQALEIAETMTTNIGLHSDKRGHLLTMVCLEFVANHPPKDKDVMRKMLMAAKAVLGKEALGA